MNFRTLAVVAVSVLTFAFGQSAQASAILGTGTGSLVGNDLTDLGNNGVEGSYTGLGNLAGFDAVFFANKEAGFGGNEFSFNVFDNVVGSGNAKSCCESVVGAQSVIIGAMFGNTLGLGTGGIVLNRFTLTSSNDTPARDPTKWSMQGSVNTTTGLDGTWFDIFVNANGSVWTARNQVVSFSAAEGDTFLSTNPYQAFRLVTTDTGNNLFALNEIELFGSTVPEPGTLALLAFGLAGLGFSSRKKA